MTVTLTKKTEWGVRFAASPDRVTHIDVRAGEDDARHWLHALHFCGNRDAELVTRDGTGAWRPVETAVAR